MQSLAEKIQATLDWLSSFGADEAGGVSRFLYDKNWQAAQQGLKQKFEEAGMTASFDEVGNLFGRIEGSKYPQETIMSGSHVDTVNQGGTLDGQYGVAAAYLAISFLVETYGQPLRNLEVVSMAEEEGSRFPYVFWGSKNIWGLAERKDVEHTHDLNGVSFVEAMHQAGFDFRKSQTIRKDIKAFLEIHIEQGQILEQQQLPIGIIKNIVGQTCYTITLKGQANHAGTTPMAYRKDAVYGYAKIVTHGIEKAREVGAPLVLTFGQAEVTPNTVNVVPGQVTFSIDCRHPDGQVLKNFREELEKDMRQIAEENGLTIELDLFMDEPPVPMDREMVRVLEKACSEKGIAYQLMDSGGGHDSQIFAAFVPTAMLFVPSIDGISHNPAEATKLEDLTTGVEALISSLYKLAYQE
ncbi:Zn-dependent hydrolase [Enterococcus florum]|uniref:Zn-dependent hydrolase n=1 Tax=Enterococcus florum TaxID=2480627 RepID=A0A4P5PCK5_9ENTE|nr:allantoate deiminase [Enterococcus florum]GCF95566.1 Zn-dependent hydrolase [Enterococcus florum]